MMIARLIGPVLALKPPQAVLNCGGVGYRVTCSQAALDACALGKVADLHTHLVVREDEWLLFGFANEDEVALFQLVISVQGVGPRTGIAMLSKLSAGQLKGAIANGQADTLARVPGIGKKTAEKIVFALRGKLGGLDALPGVGSTPISAMDTEVMAALTGLGFSVVEAQAAVAALPKDTPMDLEEKIRRALAGQG
jgi:holliday junction DNA helicase RuvA